MSSATPVVVDTDVVSFLFKAHSFAPAYQTILALAVSLITLAEIEYGMEAKDWAPAGAISCAAFSHALRRCYRTPKPISFADAWIAAAAVQLNIPLVTHTASDYAAVESLVF